MKQPSILIVDDDEDDLQFLRDGFEENGIADIGLFMDGNAVLDHLAKRDKVLPKLIISDFNMPFISGLELLKSMKQDEALSTIDVIILSTSDREPHKSNCLVSGASAYYVKPTTFEGYIEITKQFKKFLHENHGAEI